METFIPKDFKEFLQLLNAHAVEYLVVGGIAVGIHGYPRMTEDIDVWVNNSPANVASLVKAVREFGFDLPETTNELFANPDNIVRMGVKPYCIEVMSRISGVEFDKCFASRKIVQIDEINVNMIGLDDLITNKEASGRHKDLEDVEHLLEGQNNE